MHSILMSGMEGRPGTKRLIIIALAVTILHVAVLLGADVISRLWLAPQPTRDASPLSISMAIMAPVAAPPSQLRPSPRPAPAIVQSAEPVVASEVPASATVSDPSPPPPDAGSGQLPDPAPQAAPTAPNLALRTPSADELPGAGSVAIDVYWGDHTRGSHIASGSIQLSFPAEGRYAIRIVTRALGWASMFATNPLTAEAVGSLGPGGLRPERYNHRSMRGRDEVSTFDYAKGEISYSSLKEPLPLPDGVQDRLSFMIQLAWMLKMDPQRFSPGESVRIPMAGHRKVEEVDFLVLSEADLVMPGGVLVPALHLSSARQGERFRGHIDIWLDRTDRLLPVRIRFEEARGQVLDLLTVRKP
jgi:hypothetical protein